MSQTRDARDDFGVSSSPRNKRPPLPVRVVVADALVPHPGGSSAHVRLRRLRDAIPAGGGWEAVITLDHWTPLDPEDLLAHAHGFLVADAEGDVGVVEEVQSAPEPFDGTLSVGCGWFGRRLLAIPFEDVEEILPAEERLILRPGLGAVGRTRRPSSAHTTGVKRLVRGLLGRSPATSD
jgi:hypothetical protein